MTAHIATIRKLLTGIFLAANVAACTSMPSRIKGDTYTVSNAFSVMLPRPLGTDGLSKYRIQEELSPEGSFVLSFGPTYADHTRYVITLIHSAYRQSGRTGEPSDEEIRKTTLGVTRAGLEREFQSTSEIVAQETFTYEDRAVDYAVLRQQTARAMGMVNLGGKPFDLYHGIYIFSSPGHTIQLAVTTTRPDLNQLKDRSFGNMQRVFESIRLLTADGTTGARVKDSPQGEMVEVEDHQHGFSFSLPSGWTRADDRESIKTGENPWHMTFYSADKAMALRVGIRPAGPASLIDSVSKYVWMRAGAATKEEREKIVPHIKKLLTTESLQLNVDSGYTVHILTPSSPATTIEWQGEHFIAVQKGGKWVFFSLLAKNVFYEKKSNDRVKDFSTPANPIFTLASSLRFK